MSRDVRFAPEAAADLEEIWYYIARENVAAANRLVESIQYECKLLLKSPGLGRKRDELIAGLRSFPCSSYMIFYRTIDQGIEVIRILIAYRDIDSQFLP